MGSGCSEDDEDDFVDAREVFDKMSDSSSDCSQDDCSTSGFGYDYWVGNLDNSVDIRRDKLLRFMGLSSRWLIRDPQEEYEQDDFIDEIRAENSNFQNGL